MTNKLPLIRAPIWPRRDEGEQGKKPSLYVCRTCWGETRTQNTVGLKFTSESAAKGLTQERVDIFYQSCLGRCYARNHASFTGADGGYVSFCHLTKPDAAEAVMDYAAACVEAGKTLPVPECLEKKVDGDDLLFVSLIEPLTRFIEQNQGSPAELFSERSLRSFHDSLRETPLGEVPYEQVEIALRRLA